MYVNIVTLCPHETFFHLVSFDMLWAEIVAIETQVKRNKSSWIYRTL